MISFIKSNLNIVILILVLFITLDTFLLAYKAYLIFTSNLKISCNVFKSHYSKKDKLAIINLTVENKSNNPVSITRIRLTDGSKSHLATLPEVIDDYNENGVTFINSDKSININISSENILKDTKISSHGVLNGYAIFKNIELITDTKRYKIVIETPSKVFKKELHLSKL